MITILALVIEASLGANHMAPVMQSETPREISSKAARARTEVCYALAAGTAHLNLGDCLSFANAPEQVFRTEVCNFLRDSEQLEEYGFGSHSTCVKYDFFRIR